jgi:cytochrome c oxidase subunit 4
MSATTQPSLSVYIKVYLLLMLGLAATVAVAYVSLGRMNLAVALAIALAKATLVVLFFMHVLYSPRLTWIAVFSGLVWLAILLSLVGADYMSRDWIPVEPAQTGLAQPPNDDSFEPSRSPSRIGAPGVPHATD